MTTRQRKPNAPIKLEYDIEPSDSAVSLAVNPAVSPGVSSAKTTSLRGKLKRSLDAIESADEKVKEEEKDDHVNVMKANKLAKTAAAAAAAGGGAPAGWLQTYEAIKAMRGLQTAPVDVMGCHQLADRTADIKVFRFQSLVSLMLSSQTKDAMTATAMGNLKATGSCSAHGILAMDPKALDGHIKMVGFHNRKTIYLQKTAQILVDKYGGDIPSTLEGLLELPGVGPKMAFLALQTAWGKNEGIAVDVHVHRISNRLKWVNTLKDSKGPEATRAALQDWMPVELWPEVNHMLVGFGQTVCRPVKPLCNQCTLGQTCPASLLKPHNRRTSAK